MELKEAILSTLAELQEDGGSIESSESPKTASEQPVLEDTAHRSPIFHIEEKPLTRNESTLTTLHNLSSVDFDANEVLDAMIKKEPPLMPMAQDNVRHIQESSMISHSMVNHTSEFQSDRKFLEGLRERILVMFEGMQSPNNRSPEAKIDLILNFFEWQLALIDEKLEDKKS